MTEVTQNATIILRNDSDENISSSNTVLKKGEIAISYDSSNKPTTFYIGDGASKISQNTDLFKEIKQNTPKIMTGASISQDGTAGYVPAPTAGEINRYLSSDGVWKSTESIIPDVIDCGMF